MINEIIWETINLMNFWNFLRGHGSRQEQINFSNESLSGPYDGRIEHRMNRNRCSLWEWEPLYKDEGSKLVPIVYNPNYDIHFFHMDRLYSFDIKKWGKIHQKLDSILYATYSTCITPKRRAHFTDLAKIHTVDYLKWVKTSTGAAQVAEIPGLSYNPFSKVVSKKILEPIKWQVAGSVVAAKRALQTKWAINLGGGFHHCSTHIGEGFCFYADITLIMKILWEENPEYKFFIVDLDAHQGNGYARDVLSMERKDRVYIMDVFNPEIFPKDKMAEKVINKPGLVYPKTTDEQYLEKVKSLLEEGLTEFYPDLIIYNAGTDCLQGDPLGKLNLSEKCVKRRDSLVFEIAKKEDINIVMLTSGGYQENNAQVIYESINDMRLNGVIDF